MGSGQTIDLWTSLPVGQKHRFANYVYGSIHGVKFHDVDANTVRRTATSPASLAEPFLNTVAFDLYKFVETKVVTTVSNSVTTTNIWTDVGDATTDIHGEFWFTQLNPGTYEVIERSSADNWKLSTGQLLTTPTWSPTRASAFVISSRTEYAWESAAVSRPMDGMIAVGVFDPARKDGTIDTDEVQAGKNAAALKTIIVAAEDLLPQTVPSARRLWFGDYKSATLTGFKYEDLNGNGSFDAGEPGMAKIKMLLNGIANNSTTSIGQLTAITDASGNFSFVNLIPGNYTVSESTNQDINGDTVNDTLQGMVLSTLTESATLISNQTKALSNKWGNYILGSLHGVKFLDTNADGKWDRTTKDANGNLVEPSLQSITFDLYKFISTSVVTTVSNVVTTTHVWSDVGDATSDSHGEFWFLNQQPGVYEVVERNNSPWIQSTAQPTKSPSVLNTNPLTSTTAFTIQSRQEYVWEALASKRPMDGIGGPLNGTIEASEVAQAAKDSAFKVEILAAPAGTANPNNLPLAGGNRDLWFGNYQLGQITGFKYEDVNQNGVVDGSEVGLANVKMLLTGTAGTGAGVTVTALTDASGNFTFSNVIPGNYAVTESTTTDTNNDSIADNLQDMLLDSKSVAVALGSGQTIDLWTSLPVGQKHRFANYVYGSIHGVKFHDVDANTVRRTATSPASLAEPFLNTVAFDLYKFVETKVVTSVSNVVTTTNIWTDVGDATTDIHGEFWFTQLNAGTYEVIERSSADNWKLSTGQLLTTPTWSPTRASAFVISSRTEYAWESAAVSRPMDGMIAVGVFDKTRQDGTIDAGEVLAGKNAAALKDDHRGSRRFAAADGAVGTSVVVRRLQVGGADWVQVRRLERQRIVRCGRAGHGEDQDAAQRYCQQQHDEHRPVDGHHGRLG